MLKVYQGPKNAYFPLRGLMQGNECCLCSFFHRKIDPTKITETCSEMKISTCNAKHVFIIAMYWFSPKRDVFDNSEKNKPYEKKGKQNLVVR